MNTLLRSIWRDYPPHVVSRLRLAPLVVFLLVLIPALLVGVVVPHIEMAPLTALALVAFVLAVVFVDSQIALYLAVALSTLTVYRWDIGGILQLSPYRFFLLLAIVQSIFKRGPRQRLCLDRVFWILVLMVFWDALGILYSTDPEHALRTVLQESEYPITYLVVSNVIRAPKQVVYMIESFLISVLLALGFTFWQWLNVYVWQRAFTWPLWSFTRMAERSIQMSYVGNRGPGGVDRVSSVLGDSINFSNLVGVGLLLGLLWMVCGSKLHLKWFWQVQFLVILTLGPLLLLTSGSRSGLLAFLVAAIIVVISDDHFRRSLLGHRTMLALVIALIAAVVIITIPEYLGYEASILEQYMSRNQRDITTFLDAGGSLGSRLFAQIRSIETWLTVNPLLGIGKASLPYGTHGQIADALAEGGIVAGGIAIAFYFAWYQRGISGLTRTMSGCQSAELQLLGKAAKPLFWMWLVFSVTYGYWFQPFYIIWPALLVAAERALGSTLHINASSA